MGQFSDGEYPHNLDQPHLATKTTLISLTGTCQSGHYVTTVHIEQTNTTLVTSYSWWKSSDFYYYSILEAPFSSVVAWIAQSASIF